MTLNNCREREVWRHGMEPMTFDLHRYALIAQQTVNLSRGYCQIMLTDELLRGMRKDLDKGKLVSHYEQFLEVLEARVKLYKSEQMEGILK